MSGPKCGEVSIDPNLLAASEARSREELEQLSGLSQRTAAQEKRFQALQKREEARKARQIPVYQSIRDALNEAIATREYLQQKYQGIVLPPAPSIPELDETSAQSIASSSVELASICDAYLRATNLALKQWRIREKTAAELRGYAGKLHPGATQTASDVLARLSSSEQVLARRKKERYLEAAAAKASELLDSLQDEELAQETIDAVEQVFEAVCESDAQTGLMHLKTQVAKEKDRLRQQKREQQRLAEQQRQQETRYKVAETITAVLEDMGYASSTIEATAFAKDGRLYAINDEWPSHALRFTIAEDGEHLISEPVRIRESSEDLPPDQMREEDIEVDKAWCSKDGIVALRKQARSCGIDLSFRKEHEPGDVPIAAVSENELGEDLNRQRNRQKTVKGKPLASRKAPR